MKVLLTLIWIIYIYYRLKKSILMAQQNLYDDDARYFKWIKKNLSIVIGKYELLQLIPLLFGLFIHDDSIIKISFFVVYILLVIYHFGISHSTIIKKPLVYTSRVKRLYVTIFLVFTLIVYLGLKVNINYYSLLSIIGYLSYFIVLLSLKINVPVEGYVYLFYKNKAVNKLKSISNLEVIGITGSYGKTSSKNILNEILNCKYNSVATPKNLNTPYGLMMTINNYLDKYDDLFIAEMGAYKPGEIKELCDLVHPKYGILTKIGKAHMELFKTQENIQKTKFELIESLPSDGVGVLNADDPLQVNYKLKNKVKILWIGIDNDADYRASNIKMSKDGTSFDLIVDKKKYKLETKLLGYSNVYNILAAVALAHYLGINMDLLQSAVKSVNRIEHRLEIKPNGNVYYIDDAYNSNPDGCKMALRVLKMMPGTKIVITPGMVELGSIEDEENEIFGEEIADSADYVMLIGESQTKAILKGLKNKKFDENKIYVLDDITKAFPIVQKLKTKETYVLLENDLPDIFK